jgi:hypothetical protein
MMEFNYCVRKIQLTIEKLSANWVPMFCTQWEYKVYHCSTLQQQKGPIFHQYQQMLDLLPYTLLQEDGPHP